MRLIPLKQWFCDSCGGVIEKPEDGWFEWCTKESTGGKDIYADYRIVHHDISCMYNVANLSKKNIMVADHSLETVIGSDGLAYLLFEIELSEKGIAGFKIRELKEFVGILRRLHIPYWEEARLHWDRAFKDGFHDGCDFGEKSLLSIIEEYREQE